jgi:hypothetical protein
MATAEDAMSKYEPLNEFLGRLKADYWRPTFLELERILGFKLPVTARKTADWWNAAAGGRHAHANTWVGAGWKVQDVNIDKEKVTFVRTGAEPAPPPEPPTDLAGKLRDRAELAREWGAEQRGAAAQHLKDHPMTAVGVSAGIAFGIGIAIGYLLVRPSESETESIIVQGGRTEERARRALAALTERVHDLEGMVRERIERLRG